MTHRDSRIRIVGFQIVCLLATTDAGAKLLLDKVGLWSNLVEIVQDRVESYQAKELAMRTLTHLLILSSRKDSLWYGPVVTEKVSGLKMNGEASLLPFLASANFEESMGRFLRAFACHKSPAQSRISSEESVRCQSLTTSSSILSHHEVFEEPPTASFIASILEFYIQILKMDEVRSLTILS